MGMETRENESFFSFEHPAAPNEAYDINIVDVNASDDDKTLEAPPLSFVTADFIKDLARTTSVGGLAVVNVLCTSPPLTEKIFARFRAFFHGRLCYLRDEREVCV